MGDNSFFSLSIETLAGLPSAIALQDTAVIIDNTYSPFITNLTDAWKNTPVLVDEILVIFCTDGEVDVRIAFEQYKVTENSVCVVTPRTVVEVLSVSQNFHCITLAFDKDFVSVDQSTTLELLQLFKYIQRCPCNTLSGTYASRYRETFLEAVKTANWLDNPLRHKMIQSYIYLLFCCLYPALVEKGNESFIDESVTHQRRIYFKFMEMVQMECREHRTVAYYAERLELTPKYISKIIQTESGQSAMVWIDNYVMLEAKALLKQGNMQVREVAEKMSFPDQSSFGKFFHRMTGMSPKEYREKK